jgi:hypothetical protein
MQSVPFIASLNTSPVTRCPGGCRLAVRWDTATRRSALASADPTLQLRIIHQMWKVEGFHSGDSILGCDAMQSIINIATFGINVLPATSGSKAYV